MKKRLRRMLHRPKISLTVGLLGVLMVTGLIYSMVQLAQSQRQERVTAACERAREAVRERTESDPRRPMTEDETICTNGIRR